MPMNPATTNTAQMQDTYDFQKICRHLNHIPVFDAASAIKLTPAQVRKRWPRYDERCVSCGLQVTLYASEEHRILGNWPTG
jgi:hypothetical protein